MKRIALLLTLFLAAYTAKADGDFNINTDANGIVHVKQNGTGAGASWDEAYPKLADVLLDAKTNANIKAIWVAAGTYKPLHAADGASIDPRDKAFVLVEGVKIYGGFPADANDTDHTSISTRGSNPLLNATILSGDLKGDDDPDDLTANKSDNAYHVVIGAGIASDGKTILDGFSISGGYADSNNNIFVNGQAVYHSSGGGIYNGFYSSPTLTNLTISGNSANYSGGGIYNLYSSPTLTNLTISGNTANYYGGGIYNESSSPTLTNLTISGNTATDTGGGIYNTSSSPTLTNITISGNTANYGGGGIANYYNSSPTLMNITINGNSSNNGSGGGILNNDSSPTFTNVTISENTAPYGAGIYNTGASPILTNVIISGNTSNYYSGSGGGMYNGYSSSPILTNIIISGNTASSGGGIYNASSSSPTLMNITISGNTAVSGGGGIYNDSSSPKLTNTIVWGNSASYGNNVTSYNSTTTYNYSLVQDITTEDTNGNLDGSLDPLFLSTSTGNYRLQAASPVIDKGNKELYDGPDVDLDGNPRFYGENIDLGAYECPANAGILYVKQNGTGDGSSWANAYPELADVLLEAKTNANIKAIWVAAGTYKPLHAADGASTDPRDKAFVLVEGLKIYGGFPADANDADHTSVQTGRAPSLHATILSGDLEGDDDPNDLTANKSDNAYHIVIGVNIADDGETILDGFTITGGYADGNNSILVNGEWIYLNNGGGIYNYESSPRLTNLIISGNTASYGGGIYNEFSSSPTLTNITISGNSATDTGGGIYNSSSSPTLTNVTISGNTASSSGGGMVNQNNSSPTLTNITISGNTASSSGGGILNGNSSPTLTNLTISGNSATGYGGGIYNFYSSPTLTNLTISGNTATAGGGIYNVYSSPTLTNLIISGNTATGYGSMGGGICNYSSSPTLTNLTISGNTAEYGGGIYNRESSPTFTNLTISGNTAGYYGGGIYNSTSSSPKLYNTIVWGNGASSYDNVYDYSSSNPTYNYSLVQGITTEDTNGNLDGNLDPLFLSTSIGNYLLQAASPVIDKGNKDLYDGPDVDFDGNPRFYGANIDLGAYEYQPKAGILYIKQDGAGGGSSWASAYPKLADALLEAKTNANIKEIWVAAGTYKPLHAANDYTSSDDPRDKAFVLVEGLKIYGGFPADANDADHTSVQTGRAPSVHVTILSGDLEGDDDLDDLTAYRSDNVYHVVIGADIAPESETVLDGFTITGGNANVNTTITVNGEAVTHTVGGGIYNNASSPTLTNLTISGNTSTYAGGGISNVYSSSPTITNLIISGNTTSSGGAGLYNYSSSPTITNITISGNTATNIGGGILNRASSYPIIMGGTINGNTANYGGGIYNSDASPTITNVTISENIANSNGGGIANYEASSPTITNSIIIGNTAAYGGGIYSLDLSNPKLTNVIISGNKANNWGGGMCTNNASPILTNVTISGNTATNYGGGIYNTTSAAPQLYNTLVWGNSAPTENSVFNDNSTPSYNHSLVQDVTTQDANGNLDGYLDPLFVSSPTEAAPTTTGDYRLLSTSPAIDKGDNYLYEATSGRSLSSDVDLDGNPRLYGDPRFYDTRIDLGAYEFSGLIWTGLAGNSWTEPANWNTGEVPYWNLSVYIPGNLDTYPVLTMEDFVAVKEIRFGPGAEIGNQHFLLYQKAYVQLDFSAPASRNRWYMLSNPLQELYAGDFSFGGYPGMDMKLFEMDPEQDNRTVWKRITGYDKSFSVGDGFIVWLAPDNPDWKENKGLKLSKGILELPYFDNINVPADVHWTHNYIAPNSTFIGWKEENGSIVENEETSKSVSRSGNYYLAGQIVDKRLDFGLAQTNSFAIAGNPYMSSIDFEELFNYDANKFLIKGTYQIWIGPGGNSGGSYAGYNVFGGAFGREGVKLNQNIAPMQSFIVEKSETFAFETLTFDLAAIGATGGSAGLRSAAPQVNKLDIVASTAQAGVRTVIVSRQEGGSSLGSADSRKLFDEINNIPEVYTLKPNVKPGANNKQAATAVNVLGEITGETLIPLAISTTHKGELTFTFTGMDTYNARISLLDTETNTETELTDKEQYEYTFDYVPEQSGEKIVANESRFFIRLNKTFTEIEEIASEAIRIYAPYPGTLQVTSTHPLRQVTVYNLQGSMVYNTSAIQANTQKVEGLAAGVYIVKAVSGNTVTTEKVLVR